MSGHAAAVDRLCLGNRQLDVPLGNGCRSVRIGADGTAHENDSLHERHDVRVLANEVADVLQRTDGNEGDFAGMAADDIGEEITRRGRDGRVRRESLRPR